MRLETEVVVYRNRRTQKSISVVSITYSPGWMRPYWCIILIDVDGHWVKRLFQYKTPRSQILKFCIKNTHITPHDVRLSMMNDKGTNIRRRFQPSTHINKFEICSPDSRFNKFEGHNWYNYVQLVTYLHFKC